MMNLRCAFGFALVASILVGCKVLSPTSTLAQPHSPVPTQTQPTAPATEPSASSPPTEAPVAPADATQVAFSSQTPWTHARRPAKSITDSCPSPLWQHGTEIMTFTPFGQTART